MSFFVYVLRSQSSGRRYIGQTADLDRRLAQHNDPHDRLTLHTKRWPGPWVLIYSEEHRTRSAAMLRERWLKSGAGRDWLETRLPSRPPGC